MNKTKIKKIFIFFSYKIFGTLRRILFLKNKDFSIISNNCFGGDVYQSYNLKYLSPTVGLFFFAKDYLMFLSRLEYYLSLELIFIPQNKSRNFANFKEHNINERVPIGVLEDVEIVFLHYNSEIEANEKWNNRKKRVNFNKLIIKFNDQNEFLLEDLKFFDTLNFDNKLFFTNKNNFDYDFVIFFKKDYKRISIKNDTSRRNYKRYINMTKYINQMKEISQ